MQKTGLNLVGIILNVTRNCSRTDVLHNIFLFICYLLVTKSFTKLHNTKKNIMATLPCFIVYKLL